MSNPPKPLWVISDGRRGIENQALGLAESLARLRPFEIIQKHLTPSAAFKAMPPKMQFGLRSKPEHYDLDGSYPEIAIGCGRQAIAPLLALKDKLGSDIKTIYVQDPRMDPSEFDFVVAPEHDQIIGSNVISMIGSPNRITKERIIAYTLKFSEQLVHLPMPRLAMLIGGPSKTHKLSKDNHEAHLGAARFALESEWSVMISVSRRTPDRVIGSYRELAKDNDKVWLYDGKGENPYFAFLGGADIIFVTEDSTNMLTEACTAGKPTFRLPMSGDAGKFQTLYDRLEEQCHVRRYDPDIDPEPYEALRETDRVADWLLRLL